MTTEELQQLRYSEALAQYREHGPLIWSRNNFFLLVEAAFVAVVTSKEKPITPEATPLIGLIGLLVAVIWLWVNVASQLLLRQWRKIVLESEARVFPDPHNPGPFGMAQLTLKEGRNLIISITTALYVLNLGFLIFWCSWWVIQLA